MAWSGLITTGGMVWGPGRERKGRRGKGGIEEGWERGMKKHKGDRAIKKEKAVL